MSKPASFVTTKQEGAYRVFWSKKTDSHNEIIAENGLKDVPNVRGEARLIPCEVVPPDGDFLAPLDKWIFQSEIQPEWADMKEVEAICREALIDWLKSKVILPNETRDLKGDDFVLFCYGKVSVMRESSNVGVMWGSSNVGEMWESSNVGEMWESSNVGEMWGSSNVGVMWGSSKVGVMWESSKVGVMRESSKVGVMRESSNVGEMRGSSIIVICHPNAIATATKIKDQSVVIDRSGDKVKIYLGDGRKLE